MLTTASKRYEALARAYAAGRLHHAYLFSGPADADREAVADRLAADLLCLTPVNGRACHACEACHLYAVGNEPRFHRYPTPPNVDAVRELRSRLARREGRQVIWVDEADALGREAANALLKTIEEPPEGVTFFFLSERPDGILPTIRSRLQEVRFPPPSDAERVQALSADRSPEEAALIRRGLELVGHPAGALAYADDEAHRALADALAAWLAAPTHAPAGRALLLFGRLSAERKKTSLPLLFSQAAHFYRGAYRDALTAGDATAAKRHRRALTIIMKEQDHLQTNVDAQMLLERALLRIAVEG